MTSLRDRGRRRRPRAHAVHRAGRRRRSSPARSRSGSAGSRRSSSTGHGEPTAELDRALDNLRRFRAAGRARALRHRPRQRRPAARRESRRARAARARPGSGHPTCSPRSPTRGRDADRADGIATFVDRVRRPPTSTTLPDWLATACVVPDRRPGAPVTLDPHLAFARRMDRADGLAHYRKRFVGAETDLVYFDGNSLGRPPVVGDRARRAIPARRLGRSPHPRLGRVVAAAADRDRRPHRSRRHRGEGRADGHRRLDDGAALQARPRGGRRAARARPARGARSSSTPTTSRPTATCSTASHASAACACAGSRSTRRRA